MGLPRSRQSFGIVLAGMEWMSDPELMARFALSQSHVQTMLFLQLPPGATCCCSSQPDARSWSRSKRALVPGGGATQIVAVLMRHGILVPQLPWAAIGAVWLYALGGWW